jgi:hypothetical protein
MLQFSTLQARNYWIYCIQMGVKFQHHNVPLITLLRETVTCSILLCTRMSGCQTSSSLIFLDSDHLQIVFHLLDHVRTRNSSDPVNKFTDWERFQNLEHHWIFSKVHTGQRFAHGFQPSVCIQLYNKIVQATSRSHVRSWESTYSQYRTSWSQTYKI